MRKRTQPSPQNACYPRRLYRYLNSEHVESFFSTGELFLTSYQRCRAHEDQVRKDASEGNYTWQFQGTNQRMFVNHQSGDNSYMLCTSVSREPRLLAHFNVDSYFHIDDAGAFSLAVAKSIRGLTAAHSGAIIYVPQRKATRTLEGHEFLPAIQRNWEVVQKGAGGDPSKAMNDLSDELAHRVGTMTSNVSFYAKPLAYVGEMEYRMVWSTDQPALAGSWFAVPTRFNTAAAVTRKPFHRGGRDHHRYPGRDRTTRAWRCARASP